MSEFLSKDVALKGVATVTLLLVGWWQSQMVSAIKENRRDNHEQFYEISKLREEISKMRAVFEYHTHNKEL